MVELGIEACPEFMLRPDRDEFDEPARKDRERRRGGAGFGIEACPEFMPMPDRDEFDEPGRKD